LKKNHSIPLLEGRGAVEQQDASQAVCLDHTTHRNPAPPLTIPLETYFLVGNEAGPTGKDRFYSTLDHPSTLSGPLRSTFPVKSLVSHPSGITNFSVFPEKTDPREVVCIFRREKRKETIKTHRWGFKTVGGSSENGEKWLIMVLPAKIRPINM
jgi:hypothetical protein